MPWAPARAAEAQPRHASARFPARIVAMDWPATRHGRDTVWELLTRPPFVMEVASSQGTRARGLARLLDWLEDQPGETWQERWLASGAEAAGDRLGASCRSDGCTTAASAPSGCVPSSPARWGWRSAPTLSAPR